jgi:hypothetical protein
VDSPEAEAAEVVAEVVAGIVAEVAVAVVAEVVAVVEVQSSLQEAEAVVPVGHTV